MKILITGSDLRFSFNWPSMGLCPQRTIMNSPCCKTCFRGGSSSRSLPWGEPEACSLRTSLVTANWHRLSARPKRHLSSGQPRIWKVVSRMAVQWPALFPLKCLCRADGTDPALQSSEEGEVSSWPLSRNPTVAETVEAPRVTATDGNVTTGLVAGR